MQVDDSFTIKIWMEEGNVIIARKNINWYYFSLLRLLGKMYLLWAGGDIAHDAIICEIVAEKPTFAFLIKICNMDLLVVYVVPEQEWTFLIIRLYILLKILPWNFGSVLKTICL
jgi:hypothetical protein